MRGDFRRRRARLRQGREAERTGSHDHELDAGGRGLDPGQYFLLYDPDHGPAYDVDAQSLRLYLDDGNAANDANTVLGKAVLDPGGAMGLPLTPEQSAASVLGRFDPLTPGVPGHDGRVDGLGFNRQTLGRVDYARGLLFLPDLHPFAPRTDPAVSHPFESFVADHVNRRLRLGRPGAPVTPEPDLYELYNPRLTDAHWFLDVSFSRPPTGPVTSEVRH